MTDPTRLVFVGDSITDAGRDRDDPDALGDGFVALLAAEFAQREAPVRIVNVGIAGDRAVDLDRRWSMDVSPAAPDVLTVFVGVNDMWRRFDRDDPTTVSAFETTYRRLLERTSDAGGAEGPRLILVEPFFLPVHEEQRAWLDDLDPKREVVRRLARERGAGLVPLHEVMTAASHVEGVAAVAPDGVHPTPRGSRLIADAWLAVHDVAAMLH